MADETLEQTRDRLRKLLRAGVSATTIDGQATTFDLAEARRQLAAVEAEIAAEEATTPRRPVATRIVLGHD